MKWSRLLVLACVIAQSSLIAQEQVVLQTEVTIDGKFVATPQLRGTSGTELRLYLGTHPRLTPFSRD